MKTCRVCGAFVEDNTFVCPECGADLVKSSGKLSLKQDTEEKKVKAGNPMGQSISTGSGLTDILRAGVEDDGVEDADEFYGGSIPTSMARTTIEGDYSAKKKSKVAPTIFKIILVLAAAYGIFLLVTKVIMKEKVEGAKSAEEAVEIIVDAVKDNDADEIKRVIPPYVKDKKEAADNILTLCSGITIDTYRITRSDSITGSEKTELQEEIKMVLNKAINLDEAQSLTILCKYTREGVTTESEKKYIYFKVDGDWYYYGDDDRREN